ncbi:tetratricopeptide repeat protein [bacterium]
MKSTGISFIVVMVFFNACTNLSENDDILPEVDKGAQAVSLMGDPLYPAPPGEEVLSNLAQAKKQYNANPNKVDNIIWYGRRIAYTGNYREAIRIYSLGIEKFPDDARLYRHRGHRYISIREFKRAVRDFEKASELIHGKVDQIEPDGMPNAQNIPVSTLHTNIWYHLGLAHYLNSDLEEALEVYQKGIDASTNDDNIVSTAHWLYMTLRRLGRKKDAENVLRLIRTEMNVIENTAYHQLCLFYKGSLPLKSLTNPEFSNIMNDAVAYGAGNWFLYNGEKEKAETIFKNILKGESWSSFGYIAAEADFVREFGMDSKD